MLGYVTADYYTTEYRGDVIPLDSLEKVLETAERDIDRLTFYSINRIGWNNLSEFQQNQLKLAVCIQADHNTSRAEYPSTVDSYSMNGTSVKFKIGSDYSSESLSVLNSTGLRNRMLR